MRLTDRVGKGLRGAPRDAMLGALAPADQRGRVFGYHRAMDHAGAVVGPLVASAFLWLYPGEYRLLFALTIVPGLAAVFMVTLVPDTPAASDAPAERTRAATATPRSATALPPTLRRYFFVLALFTLGNSTDAFLLLRLSEAGLATTYVPLAWSALHVVKSSLSTLGGTLSDRFGRRQLIVAGWALYALVYLGFAFSETLLPLLTLFLIYGVHFAMVEGGEKALVADLTPHALHGTAFGWYNAVLGFGALAASVLFGVLWQTFGPRAAFVVGAALAVGAATLLALIKFPDAATEPGEHRP